jgi:hypothetical protein
MRALVRLFFKAPDHSVRPPVRGARKPSPKGANAEASISVAVTEIDALNSTLRRTVDLPYCVDLSSSIELVGFQWSTRSAATEPRKTAGRPPSLGLN